MIRVVESVVVEILTNNQLVHDRKVAIVFGIILGRRKGRCGLQNAIFVFATLEMGLNMEQSCVRFSNAQISRIVAIQGTLMEVVVQSVPIHHKPSSDYCRPMQ